MKTIDSIDLAPKGSKMGAKQTASLFLFICLNLAIGVDLYAQPNFYQGKTVRLVIGSSAGGGYDLWARLIARYLGKHIPGHPEIVPQNMPGAGGVVAAVDGDEEHGLVLVFVGLCHAAGPALAAAGAALFVEHEDDDLALEIALEHVGRERRSGPVERVEVEARRTEILRREGIVGAMRAMAPESFGPRGRKPEWV